MDAIYEEGDANRSDGLLRRQEASSLHEASANRRIALQEAISLIRLGVADRLCVPDESHLQDPVTRAVACAEVLSVGGKVTIGLESIATDGELALPQALACEAARERYRLLPPAAGFEEAGAYISRGWPSDEECARLAHKLVYEMSYSQTGVARIFEAVDGFDRPAVWVKQGVNRILWVWDGEEKNPRYFYREVPGIETRRPGRLHLPGALLDAMAVLGDERAEAAARRFDAALAEPHKGVLPWFDPRHQERSVAGVVRQILETGAFRTLYVLNPDEVFSTETQRRVVYDLALFRDVRVVEGGTRIDTVTGNPHYNRLLREGTKLFVALWIRDSATVLEESRSLAHARRIAVREHSQGKSLRKIAATLQAEAIPTKSGEGSWGPSMVRGLLDDEG